MIMWKEILKTELAQQGSSTGLFLPDRLNVPSQANCCKNAIESINALGELDYPFLNMKRVIEMRNIFTSDRQYCEAVWTQLLEVTINIKGTRWWDIAY